MGCGTCQRQSQCFWRQNVPTQPAAQHSSIWYYAYAHNMRVYQGIRFIFSPEDQRPVLRPAFTCMRFMPSFHSRLHVDMLLKGIMQLWQLNGSVAAGRWCLHRRQCVVLCLEQQRLVLLRLAFALPDMVS